MSGPKPNRQCHLLGGSCQTRFDRSNRAHDKAAHEICDRRIINEIKANARATSGPIKRLVLRKGQQLTVLRKRICAHFIDSDKGMSHPRQLFGWVNLSELLCCRLNQNISCKARPLGFEIGSLAQLARDDSPDFEVMSIVSGVDKPRSRATAMKASLS